LAASGAAPVAGRAVADLDLGGAVLTAVSDGPLVLPAGMAFSAMSQAELGPIRVRLGLTGDTIAPVCNVTLMRAGGWVVLFDAGSEPNFMPTTGNLAANLVAAGVAPEKVTDVVFTHAHSDHIWGVLDDFDDPLFPEAAYYIGQEEMN